MIILLLIIIILISITDYISIKIYKIKLKENEEYIKNLEKTNKILSEIIRRD